jgi:DNA-binding MarR family transcriptional regulator
MDNRTLSIQRVLDCSGALFRSLHPGQNHALLSVDLTMPQLKTLACVATEGGATSGYVARSLGVGLSTVTGIVDRLVEQGLVERGENPRDRRITLVVPTPRGKEMVDDLLRWRNEQLTKLLTYLDAEQLSVVEQGFQYLLAASASMAEAAHAREAVA